MSVNYKWTMPHYIITLYNRVYPSPVVGIALRDPQEPQEDRDASAILTETQQK